jgi:hypothetical protein
MKSTEEKKIILQQAKLWFKNSIAINHVKNAKKLESIKEFNVNPFLAIYLANFLTGNSNPNSIAKALVYPRVLGTSITTSFGTHMQKFTSEVLSAYSSTTSGIDIEFIDQVDGRKKYCQLKSGPNTINKDDVESISSHFKSVINLARTNGLSLSFDDMIVGVIYGENKELSSHYKRITSQYYYPVYIGKEFWLRLTGDDHFYLDLIEAIGSVAIEADYASELERVIQLLSETQELRDLTR